MSVSVCMYANQPARLVIPERANLPKLTFLLFPEVYTSTIESTNTWRKYSSFEVFVVACFTTCIKIAKSKCKITGAKTVENRIKRTNVAQDSAKHIKRCTGMTARSH
jgi:hypothetical protein